MLSSTAVRAVVQRVSQASVSVLGESRGSIGAGLVVLLGVQKGDGDDDARALADKVLNLRVFQAPAPGPAPDSAERMNRSVLEVGGGILVVSQFTLLGDARRGRRPSYIEAAPPEEADRLYGRFVAELRSSGLAVETGVFRATMELALVNQGPVTILLDSRKLF